MQTHDLQADSLSALAPEPVLNMIPVRTNGRYADVNNRDHVMREGLADPSGPEHRHYAAISDEPVPSIQKAALERAGFYSKILLTY